MIDSAVCAFDVKRDGQPVGVAIALSAFPLFFSKKIVPVKPQLTYFFALVCCCFAFRCSCSSSSSSVIVVSGGVLLSIATLPFGKLID